MLVDMQLVRDIAVLDDGACDELREHDHIGTEVDDVALGFHIPAVDVDGIGEGLEGVEADAQRQSADALNFGKGGAQQGIGAAQHEVCIFEVEQHPQAADEGNEQERLAQSGFCVKVLDGKAAYIIDEDEGHHDREKAHLAPAVEHQTAKEQHGILELCGREIVQRQRDGQKAEQEDDGAENQGVSLLFYLKKPMPKMAPALGGSDSERDDQARALSTALSRSAVHSLEAITMTTVLSLKAMTAFSTLVWAWANSA